MPWISIKPITTEASPSLEHKFHPADDSSFLVINHINIFGNDRTHKEIVLRELELYPGDTIYADVMDALLEEKRQRLLNSSLFLTVQIYPLRHGLHAVDLNIEVMERQYFLVLPLLGLADRNFNVWWVKHHHKLNRLNYGIKLYENNLTGNKDRLSAGFTLGYTQKFELEYEFPYFNEAFNQGVGVELSYSRNKELNYKIDSNKQEFFKGEDFIKENFKIGLRYMFKEDIRLKHIVSLSYNSFKVADTVLALNSNYFPNEDLSQRYFELKYEFSYIGTDIWAYPLHGYSLSATFSRKGLGILGDVNETKITVNGSKYWQLFENTYLENDFTGSIRLPAEQPYFLFDGIGYKGQYLKGMEYYVMNGNYFAILSNSLKKRILAVRIHSRFLPEEFATIPVKMYLKVYGDVGYNHSKVDRSHDYFSNRFLYSYGIGLDVVSFYDAVLGVECSINQLGEKGVFLHFTSAF